MFDVAIAVGGVGRQLAFGCLAPPGRGTHVIDTYSSRCMWPFREKGGGWVTGAWRKGRSAVNARMSVQQSSMYGLCVPCATVPTSLGSPCLWAM